MSVEKAISPEERIRRAEEIYARRRNVNSSYTRVNVGEGKAKSPIRKMLIQICICVIVYTGFYFVKSGNDVLLGQFIEQVKSILEYDISFQSFTDKVLSYINKSNEENAEIPEENKEIGNDEEVNLDEGITETSNEVQADTLGVVEEVTYSEDASSISQMQVDSEYIKQNVSFIKPLSGTITSRFGIRHPTSATVPTYHTGIDISGNVGTKIIAAMEGEVTLVSTKGDYRESYKNN